MFCLNICNRNGDTYAGEYFADKMHGFGTYGFANGHRYEGAWHEGRRQGLGMYSFRNGETQAGHWQNGVLDTSSTHNTFSGSYIGVDNSKVLHAVQVNASSIYPVSGKKNLILKRKKLILVYFE